MPRTSPGSTQLLDIVDEYIVEHPHLKRPRVSVMFHFGEKDTHIPLTAVEAIKAAYPQGIYHLYPAEHGFNYRKLLLFGVLFRVPKYLMTVLAHYIEIIRHTHKGPSVANCGGLD
jgi:hypothetical protein